MYCSIFYTNVPSETCEGITSDGAHQHTIRYAGKTWVEEWDTDGNLLHPDTDQGD